MSLPLGAGDRRRVVLTMDINLDGFVATTDSDVSWIFVPHSEDAQLDHRRALAGREACHGPQDV
jgi:hypothetical protein